MGLHSVTVVGAPVRVVYDRWTRFEGLPRCMPLVRRVVQVRPTTTRWWVGRGLLRSSFHAEVTEQHPDDRVAWRSLDGRWPHDGEVTFRAIDERRTEVDLRLSLGDGVRARAVEALLRRPVDAQLAGFAAFVEGAGDASDVADTWRGTIHRGRVQHVEKDAPAHPGWIHG